MSDDKLIKVELDDYILLHNLVTLADQYDTTVDRLINISIRRLIDDIEFVRGLRKGNTNANAR